MIRYVFWAPNLCPIREVWGASGGRWEGDPQDLQNHGRHIPVSDPSTPLLPCELPTQPLIGGSLGVWGVDCVAAIGGIGARGVLVTP